MKDAKIKFKLWDPLMLDHDHKELNKLGIKTLKDEPKDVKVALLCVRHTQFKISLRILMASCTIIKMSLEFSN
jgi:hypothetical protein